MKLPLLLFAYRTSVHETTGETPFSMMLGREAWLPEDLTFGLPVGDARECVEHLKKTMQNAYKSIQNRAGKQCSTRRMYMMKGRISASATRRVAVSGTTVLLSQEVTLPSSINLGRGRIKWKSR